MSRKKPDIIIEDLSEDFKIENPLKDHDIFMPPLVDPPIEIKKGEPVSIPNFLKQTMITEKVIKG